MEKIRELSSLDHFSVIVENREDIYGEIKEKFEKIGFPMSMDTGRKSDETESKNLFAGREYIEFLRLKQKGDEALTEDIYRWNTENRFGMVRIFLRTPNIEAVYNNLLSQGIFVKSPDRGQYRHKKENKTMPWIRLNLPVIDSVPIQITWIQLDTMVNNMLSSGPRPNSRHKNGVSEFSKVEIEAPFTDPDMSLLKKAFPTEEKNFTFNLKDGALSFVKSRQGSGPKITLHCPTEKTDFIGKALDFYNFSLKIVERPKL